MSNSVVTTANNTALAGYADPWSKVAATFGADESVSYVKFDGNSGEYIAGSEKTELAPGTRLVVNMDEFKAGFICWKGGQVIDERMVRVIDGQEISVSDLPDHGPYENYEDGTADGWSEQRSVPFKGFDGIDYVFKTTSKSGLRALGNLLSEFAKGIKLHGGEKAVVELGSVSFVPKTKKNVGKKYAPSFKIVAWMNDEAIEQALATAAEEAEEEVTAKPAAARKGRARF